MIQQVFKSISGRPIKEISMTKLSGMDLGKQDDKLFVLAILVWIRNEMYDLAISFFCFFLGQDP